ncbi:flagellin N-terminal helical domain-containing protein [Thiovibrio frasassiensis]|uniref:Flagellin n=1 Tax=Thiovibrio frasassiensis TaxID=2984131 RepID=A0A9X4RLP4_9BACT|nr:flagellin [Thiovibrio frasassiensis]MDG4476316.1 flagellin [Thiovibrio frasassiensis]
MAITINSDSSSSAVNQLGRSQKNLASSLERIASARRINKAADDVAGMTIADSLLSQTRATGQALRNANDAISMAQVADSALGQSTALVQSIREKAMQAANASQTTATRQALQNDINNSLVQLNKIAQDTTYNGQQLLSGSFTGKEVQTGANSGETIKLSIASATPDKLGSPILGNLSEVNVLSRENAQAAIKIADAALNQIGASRGDIGSAQQQLASTINNLATTGSNLLSAASTTADVNMAEEAINFTTMKVLTEAKTFALAQAKNMNKQNVLSLLQG